ncbi:MAG: helix-turn-helix transcriptional regulator [Rhizonema sp. PD38]|nr:helix-turn-helix transcriptional regulator [Rhizonema sp. PD38]
MQACIALPYTPTSKFCDIPRHLSAAIAKPMLQKIDSGEQLKQMRIAKGLSQSGLASKIGRSAS